jgi:hypothetical protein
MRSVLAATLGLEEVAVHNWRDLPADLSDKCVLQLHWYREPNFQKILSLHGFQVIVLARHPLDVLISVLHYTRYEPDVSRWLEGNAEIPRQLAGMSPVSPDFLRYATGWGAENLLSVTYQWWHDSHALKIKYEDLVRDPGGTFAHVVDSLNGSQATLSVAIERFKLPVFQATPNKQGWQGKPGLWRQLLPFVDAFRIYRRHHRIFDVLGYSVGPNMLSRKSALRNWELLRVDPESNCS